MKGKKLDYVHYRVPISYRQEYIADYGEKAFRRGRPESRYLFKYSRGRGFYVPCGRPFPRGGKTVCSLIQQRTGYVIARGVALCSMQENFEYAEGRRRAKENLFDNILSDEYVVMRNPSRTFLDAREDDRRYAHCRVCRTLMPARRTQICYKCQTGQTTGLGSINNVACIKSDG